MKITVPRLKAYKMKISEIYWQAVWNKCLNSARSSFGFGAKNAFSTETLEQRDDKVVRRMPRVYASCLKKKNQIWNINNCIVCYAEQSFPFVMEKCVFSIWKVVSSVALIAGAENVARIVEARRVEGTINLALRMKLYRRQTEERRRRSDVPPCTCDKIKLRQIDGRRTIVGFRGWRSIVRLGGKNRDYARGQERSNSH